MGNWHCVTSSCAEVNYREYEAPKIRWRYGTEAWQEIIGADDYTTEIVENLTQNTNYELVYRTPIIFNGALQSWNTTENKSSIGTHNGIQSWRMKYINYAGTVIYTNPYCTFTSNPNNAPPPGQRNISVYIEIQSQGTTTTQLVSGGAFGFWGLRVQPRTVSLQSKSCIFKVFKNGQIVHQETRSTCPEVEKISCTLSATNKVIKVDKLPYLERVEVVPYAYLNFGLNVFQAPIPSNCLNIYNNLTTTIIPLSNSLPTPSNASQATYNFVDQICSYPGCPPPQFEVLCDSCGCESCPEGTCPIECGDHICCYNDYGVSIKEIPLADYCGGNS
jgi:hypothetical protein